MNNCLPEPALWPAAAGDHVPPDIASHLQTCAVCKAQVMQLRDYRRRLFAASIDADGLRSSPPDSLPLRTEPAALGVISESPAADDRRPAFGSDVSQRSCPPQIGRYPVERLLKLGGQAEVYLARHPTLRINVVVKWAYARITAEPHIADRITEEARLLSTVRHRHLPRVFDLGLAADRPFLVLEYLAGGTLGAPRNEPLTDREAALLIAKVARALHAVHEFGRLHLDIQPDNILMGHDGEPRLIDFGMSLSRAAGPEPRRRASLQGTPEYMAPEQLTGEVERIGVATDIYALGAVLHELVTGIAPQPEVLWQGEPPRSSFAPPIGNSVSTGLERICRRTLDPDPRRRYASACEFARNLERFAAGSRRPGMSMIAGLLIAIGSGLGIGAMVTGPSSFWAAPQIRSGFVSQPQRRDLIAGAVNRLFSELQSRDRTVSIILADGRTVPVATQLSESSASARQFANSIADLLDKQPGTTLLLLSDSQCRSHSAIAVCGRLHSPPLPAGTIAHVTDGDVSIVTRACSSSPAESALVHSLSRLQRIIRQRTSRFSALVLTEAPRGSSAEGLPSEGAQPGHSDL